MLYEKFSPAGPILSIRICRDKITAVKAAYVNYQQPVDAKRALETLNFDVIKGRPVRIMWSQPLASARAGGATSSSRTWARPSTTRLCTTSSAFGNILSCKVA